MKFFDQGLIRDWYNISDRQIISEDEYEKSIRIASQKEWVEREKVCSILGKELASLFLEDFFHDAFLKKIEINKFKSSRLPEVRITIRKEKKHGMLIYNNVTCLTYHDIFQENNFHQECLFDELFFTNNQKIMHNYLLYPVGEINLECDSICWKSNQKLSS